MDNIVTSAAGLPAYRRHDTRVGGDTDASTDAQRIMGKSTSGSGEGGDEAAWTAAIIKWRRLAARRRLASPTTR